MKLKLRMGEHCTVTIVTGRKTKSKEAFTKTTQLIYPRKYLYLQIPSQEKLVSHFSNGAPPLRIGKSRNCSSASETSRCVLLFSSVRINKKGGINRFLLGRATHSTSTTDENRTQRDVSEKLE